MQAGFRQASELQRNVRATTERAQATGRDGNHRRLPTADEREQAADLISLPAVGQGEQQIVGSDTAEVAVQRLGRMDEVGLRARRSKRRGNLAANEAGLADAGDDDATPDVLEQIDRGDERGVEPPGKIEQRLTFLRKDGAFSRNWSKCAKGMTCDSAAAPITALRPLPARPGRSQGGGSIAAVARTSQRQSGLATTR